MRPTGSPPGVALRDDPSVIGGRPDGSTLADLVDQRAATKRVSRWWLLGAFVVSLAAFIPDAFGRQVSDTKVDLVASPVTLVSHLIYLWDPSGWFGTLRDQYIGYAFPTGPLFVLGHYLSVPPWLTERLWMAIFVTIAFWGVIRLTEELNIGSAPTRIAAAAAYALWPTFTILVGSTTSAVAPGMLLPWVLIPLVRGSRAGPTIRAAAWSGVAVLLMGGVNATDTLCSLLVPAIFLITREPGPRKRSLASWWVVSVVCATAWWALSLPYLGKYGFSFLPYTEQSITINSTMSATSVLSGTGDWVAGIVSGNLPWDQAGRTEVLLPVIVLGAALVAATGLYGVARRDMHERRFLVLSLGIVAIGTMAAYWGHLGAPLGAHLRPILDGPLAPFRNVYKLEPSIGIIVVLGIAHSLNRIPRRVPPTAWKIIAGLATAAVLGILATPYLMGRAVQVGSFRAIPHYWYQTANYLADNSPRTTALVIPASAHGQYVWGWPLDQPLEALARSPWADREATPFGGPASTRVIDAVELALKTGLPAPGLPAFLQRSGIKYLVLQNDVEWQLSDSPSPQQIHAVLGESGFTRVAKFGPTIETATSAGPILSIQNWGRHVPYPAVEIFAASSPSLRVNSPVSTYAASRTVLASGGPEGVLQLFNSGAMARDNGLVLAGDWHGQYKGPLFAVTDTLRRVNTLVGLMNDNASFTYTANEKNPSLRKTPDQPSPPRQMLPFPGVNHQTVAVFTGIRGVSASSYGTFLLALPEYNFANVLISGSPNGWISGSPYGGEGEWIQINFNRPINPAGTRIEPIVFPGSPQLKEVRINTDHGSATTNLRAKFSSQLMRVPAGNTRVLRVTLVRVARSHGFANPGIQSISIPGIHVQSYLKPPEEHAGFGAHQLMFSFQAAQVDPTDIIRSPPEPVLAREFSLPRKMSMQIVGQATPRKGPELDGYISPSQLNISASSTYGDLPALRPQNLIDGNAATSWVAASQNASLSMQWPAPRMLSSLTIAPSPSGSAAAPQQALIKSPSGSRLLHLNGSAGPQTVSFPALDTNQVTITFPKVATRKITNTFRQSVQAPVGLSELQFPALSDYQVQPVIASAPFSLSCGSGPPIHIDGKSYQTSLQGTLGDLVGIRPVNLAVCSGGPLELTAGTHRLISPLSASLFTLSGLTIRQTVPVAATHTAGRSTHVLSWQSESRKVRISPGPATYLEVHQNYDKGWTATLNGKTLTPIRLDGWQQGYVVPAGAGGIVTLTFTPEGPFLIGLAVSVLAVVVLILLALGVFSRRRGVKLDPAPARPSRGHGWVGIVLAAAVIFIVGGPMVLVVPPLALVGKRWPRAIPWLAAGGMAAAGVFAAVNPSVNAFVGTGSFGWGAQACALFALAAALVPVSGWFGTRSKPRHSRDRDGKAQREGPADGRAASPTPPTDGDTRIPVGAGATMYHSSDSSAP